tara:strand:+ start:11132 stop:11404 length:273 start_codon:yes stop_codon:yes gene_type:complete
METNNVNQIEDILKSNEIILLKFDKKNSKYNEYFNSLDFKIVNITDEEIISFYEIDTLPTILIYKNNNLIDSIIGFNTKTELIKKILQLI